MNKRQSYLMGSQLPPPNINPVSASTTEADEYDDSEYYFVTLQAGVAEYVFFGQSEGQAGGAVSSLQSPGQLVKGEEMDVDKIGISVSSSSLTPITTAVLAEIYQVMQSARITWFYSGRDQGRWSVLDWFNGMPLTVTPATAGDHDNVNMPNFVQRWKTLTKPLPLEQQYTFGMRLNCFTNLPTAALAEIRVGIHLTGVKVRRK